MISDKELLIFFNVSSRSYWHIALLLFIIPNIFIFSLLLWCSRIDIAIHIMYNILSSVPPLEVDKEPSYEMWSQSGEH